MFINVAVGSGTSSKMVTNDNLSFKQWYPFLDLGRGSMLEPSKINIHPQKW